MLNLDEISRAYFGVYWSPLPDPGTPLRLDLTPADTRVYLALLRLCPDVKIRRTTTTENGKRVNVYVLDYDKKISQ